MGPPKGSTDDLAKLESLDESSLIEELHQRYKRDVIYTYIGDILISVNPYHDIPGCYGEEIGQRYGGIRCLGDLKPHVYALASQAYHNVLRNQGNQCLLVSGESGAGKTEITKIMVAQLARLSQSGGEYYLQEKIIEVNPLLEAFGNATTVMNINSSRFGKLIELFMSEEGKLLGACITEHMLEKSRVARQLPGEKNFHIFYNMMCGFSPDERKRYFLDRPEVYRILDPGHGDPVIASPIDYQGYAETMNNIRRIMPIVGFTHQDMDVVFALLAAILHLCNIEMAVEPESEEVIVMNEEEIDYSATLLSVNPEDLITVLLANINWVRGERIVYIKTLSQAVDGRDALAKALYARLFSWIVQQINFMLHVEPSVGSTSVISILDMAGFEHFPTNSLEQLFINAANERLQHFFNEHIFSQELQEYQQEGIKQPKIKFSNNADLLNMLFQRHTGLFSLLEEECLLGKTTDMTLVDKFNKEFAKTSDLYKKPKHRDPIFSIVHYAGMVTYTADGFLEKNRDTVSSNMYSLMENSQNNLVNELFTVKVLNTGTLDMRQGSGKSHWQRPSFSQPPRRSFAPGDSLSRQAGRKIRQKMKEQQTFQDIPVTTNPNTTSAHFKNSLQLLLDKLKDCEPHFIRCLKPNNLQAPCNFDVKVVQEQLRSTGVMETIKIRRLGYAVRLTYHNFLQRYQPIAFPFSALVEPSPRVCSHILRTAKLSDAQMGSTKVFLKYWQYEVLNAIMDTLVAKVVQVQARIRTCLQRKHFLHHQKMSQQDADDFRMLAQYIDNNGNAIYLSLVEQNNNDLAMMARQSRGQPNGAPDNDLQAYYNADMDQRLPDVFSPTIGPSITDANSFYQHILHQVDTRLHDLDPDVWCKIFYMEYGKPVAKFYICDREVTIDGSTEEFTGKLIGLGAFSNPQRGELVDQIRSFIGRGLTLTKESDGSISATRLGKNTMVVKGWEDPSNHCLSADVILHEGQLPQLKSVKIFDMAEFKSHLGLAYRSHQMYNKERLQQLSVCGISFIEDTPDDLLTPCWLCVISINAFTAMKDPEVKKEVQQKFVELSLRDKQKVDNQQNLQNIANKHQRNWSKLNPRQTDQAKKEPLRKSRIQLRKMGETVLNRMESSWDNSNYDGASRQKNIEELEEEYDKYDDGASVFPQPGNEMPLGRQSSLASSMAYPDVASTRKDWAKIKVAVKQERTHEAEVMEKQKNARS